MKNRTIIVVILINVFVLLQMFAMGWSNFHLRFQLDEEGVDLDSYVVNGEWEIVSSELKVDTEWELAGFTVLNNHSVALK